MSENKFKFGNLHLKDAKEVSEYTNNLITLTEELITNTIPDKIFYLDKIDKEEFLQYNKDLASVTSHVEFLPQDALELAVTIVHKNNDGHTPSAKKRKLSNSETDGVVGHLNIPCNKKLVRLIDLIKPEVKDMVEICEKIQTWIQLLIPRIEDGNNFGVSIQEEVLNEVHRIQNESVNYLDAVSRYFMTRGKIISKLIKYPYLDDYRRAIKEVDEKEYMTLQFSINEIRSHYMLILDVVSKNYDKIKKPRSSSNIDSMY